MPSVDISNLDFLKILAVVVVSATIKAASDFIHENSRRKRTQSDIEVVERLSALDLTCGERDIVEAYRSRVISELPSKQSDGFRLTPSDVIFMLGLGLAIFLVFTGGTWFDLIVLCVAMFVLFVAAKVSYELGILEGRSRERKNIIAKKRLEYERPEQVRDRE